VLVAVAERLIGSCRDADLVARLAGDEFVVLCQGPLTRADGERLAHRIRARTADPVVTPAGPVTVGASVGVALARFGDTADELLLRADIRMYDDKRARAEAGQATRCGARMPADMASGRS
jgi:diguanylate cyclase (GGDEF)-like protein